MLENPTLEIYAADVNGNAVKLKARDTVAAAQEDARAIAELDDCIGASEVPF